MILEALQAEVQVNGNVDNDGHLHQLRLMFLVVF